MELKDQQRVYVIGGGILLLHPGDHWREEKGREGEAAAAAALSAGEGETQSAPIAKGEKKVGDAARQGVEEEGRKEGMKERRKEGAHPQQILLQCSSRASWPTRGEVWEAPWLRVAIRTSLQCSQRGAMLWVGGASKVSVCLGPPRRPSLGKRAQGLTPTLTQE